jgi:hypothetical protein
MLFRICRKAHAKDRRSLWPSPTSDLKCALARTESAIAARNARPPRNAVVQHAFELAALRNRRA